MEHDHSMHVKKMEPFSMNPAIIDTTMAPLVDHHSMHKMDHSVKAGHQIEYDGSTSMDHNMPMYFHFGMSELILFKFWQTESLAGLLISIFVIAAIAVAYEGLKWSRVTLDEWYAMRVHSRQKNLNPTHDEAMAINRNEDDNVVPSTRTIDQTVKAPYSWRLFQSLLYGVQLFLSYLLMLVFMTYNVWLCMGVLIGAMIGNLLFSHSAIHVMRSHLLTSDHCH